jgi:hypothetical protein
MSASSYFPALPPEMVEAGESSLPPVVPAAPDTDEVTVRHRGELKIQAPTLLPVETGMAPIVAPRRRGLYFALGSIVVLGIVALTIGLAATRKSRSASISAEATILRDAGLATGTINAGALDGGTAIAISDARAAVSRPDAGTSSITSPRLPPRNLEAATHLKNAEAAARTGNRLGQLAEADLALKADPRNVRAKYLLADALIQGDDLDRGCKYLRALGRNPLAVARAKSAKCPTD